MFLSYFSHVSLCFSQFYTRTLNGQTIFCQMPKKRDKWKKKVGELNRQHVFTEKSRGIITNVIPPKSRREKEWNKIKMLMMLILLRKMKYLCTLKPPKGKWSGPGRSLKLRKGCTGDLPQPPEPTWKRIKRSIWGSSLTDSIPTSYRLHTDIILWGN